MIKCTCGAIITDYGYYNKENEIGEYYFDAYADCGACGKEYESSGWGEIEGDEELIQVINDTIQAKR